MNDQKYAALFVDYENLYYFLSNRLEFGQDPSDAVARMIRGLRIMLQQNKFEQCVIQHAYADFDRIEESAQSALYLLGVESHHVLGTEHKNAADMQLCIDAMVTLYTRPEITSFVFMGGDRDYIPVIQHLRKHAKTVRVTSFTGNVSGDLLQVAGEENFIDAEQLLPSAFVLHATDKSERRPTPSAAPTPIVPAPVAVLSRPAPPRFAAVRALNERERTAISIMLENFGDKPEVWMTPYLHRLREEMPLLAEYERKSLLSDLVDAGAIAIEKRPGEPREFSVIVPNWAHPEVKELNP